MAREPIWRRAFTFIRWAAEAYGILQLGTAVGATAVTAAVLGIFFDPVRDAALGWQIMLFGGAAILWLAIIRLAAPIVVARLWHPERSMTATVADEKADMFNGIEFYPDRPSMVSARGGLKKELAGVYVAWASWYSGTHAAAEETFRTTHKPQKLLLLKPDGKFAQTIARLFLRPLNHFKMDVETTCAKALEAGTDVRLFDGPMTLMLIAEPEAGGGKGWVRIEIAIPGSAVRPNIVIHEAARPELFREFVAAFKAVFDGAETISFVGAGQISTPTPTPDTEDSRPQ